MKLKFIIILLAVTAALTVVLIKLKNHEVSSQYQEEQNQEKSEIVASDQEENPENSNQNNDMNQGNNQEANSDQNTEVQSENQENHSPINNPPANSTHEPEQPAAQSQYPLHRNITATVFWVGEPQGGGSSEDNAISAWDDNWQQSYGGFDDPENRDGYYPVGFTPKETPF